MKKPRGQKLKDIINFWADAPMGSKTCECGKKPEYHEFCGECWEDYGREKVLTEAKREHEKLDAEIEQENTRLEKLWKLFRTA